MARTPVSTQSRTVGGGADNLAGVVNVVDLFFWGVEESCVRRLCDMDAAVQHIYVVHISQMMEPKWR